MGVSFGEVLGDIQPDVAETPETAQPEAPTPPPPLDPIELRRETTRLRRRDARLRAT